MSGKRSSRGVGAAARTLKLSTGRSLQMGFQTSLDWLRVNKEVIDRLNVFPVPDGDTGTNMVLTMEAALEEVRKVSTDSAADVSRAAARGALMGARGNSGVILSQIIGGMAKGLERLHRFTAHQFAESLLEAYESAYRSVSKPVEGTILTVARHAGHAAVNAGRRGESVEAVLVAAVEAAERSVRDTPNKLAVLREAGVVDAGGQGLYIILDGFLKYLRGEEVPAAAAMERAESMFAAFALEHAGDEQGYCTQFVIQGLDLDVDAMRTYMEATTDSAIVVGGAELARFHVHTERPGDVLNYAGRFGELNRITIDNMQLQQAEHFARVREDGAATPRPAASNVVAVASGSGFRQVLESLGVSVIAGGQTMNPSIGEILSAIDASPGEYVIVLPNNANIVMAARQAAQASSKDVRVLETLTVPHGVAAALAFNPTAGFEDNVEWMLEAISTVTALELTRATRDATVGGIIVKSGEYLGLVNGDLEAAGPEPGPVIAAILGKLDASVVEIVTVYRGDAPDHEEEVVAALRSGLPDAEIEVVHGGQAHYDYVISLE